MTGINHFWKIKGVSQNKIVGHSGYGPFFKNDLCEKKKLGKSLRFSEKWSIPIMNKSMLNTHSENDFYLMK